MKSVIKGWIRKSLINAGLVKIPFGPLRGNRILYRADLNLDMLLGIHEPNTFALFNQIVRAGMNVADIGANVGYFTIFLDKRVGAKGSVHAFEPIPDTFATLRKNLSLNAAGQTRPVQRAVGAVTGEVLMHLGNGHYMASIDSAWAGGGSQMAVSSITLDDYTAETGTRFDLIKMDIEGGGVWALEGMQKTILEQQPMLFLESHTPAEDIAIGRALQLLPYEVFRVGSSAPVLHLDKDHTSPYGVYGTVVGIPKMKLAAMPGFKPAEFQKRRLGQR